MNWVEEGQSEKESGEFTTLFVHIEDLKEENQKSLSPLTGLTRKVKETYLNGKEKAITGNKKIMKEKISQVKANIY